MQIVYISNRPDIAQETLEYVENLMPFVTEALFVCPGYQVNDFQFKSRVPVRAIDEAGILGKDLGRFRNTGDHQFRNCLLRFSLARMADLGDEFMMSDDDNRPLVEIPLSFYKTEGRHKGYYYYDLRKWRPFGTDYDKGQHETRRILEEKGFETLSYSSHMPQIIHKGLLAEAAEVFQDSLNRGAPLDEWSAYFNYARSTYPERFNSPEPFRTLCWPPFPSDWAYYVRPDRFCFENFYPILYEKNRIFSDLPTCFDAATYAEIATKKIERREALQNTFDAGNLSVLGKLFFLCRDISEHFPGLKRRLNAMIPSSTQAALLHFFIDGASKSLRARKPPTFKR